MRLPENNGLKMGWALYGGRDDRVRNPYPRNSSFPQSDVSSRYKLDTRGILAQHQSVHGYELSMKTIT